LFLPCKIGRKADLLDKVFKPNSTKLIDIVIQGVVDKEVFRLEKLDLTNKNFKKIKPSGEIVK